MTVTQNIARLNHLLRLYNLTSEELLSNVNEGLKKPIGKEELFSSEIKLNYLKRIDKFFNKGLHYYIDPKAPNESKEASIFFRKHIFNSELNLGTKKIVNHFEELKISLSAVAKLADVNFERSIPVFRIIDDPYLAASKIRCFLYPTFKPDLKSFLKSLITKLAEQNILVFEFVENWNKKEKVNIDGFFINPNVLVLKRQHFRREIFTLIHELAHYLLNEEEIEKLEFQTLAQNNLSSVEKWCNDFAYYFLVGDYSKVVDNLDNALPENDYYFDLIEKISSKTHFSKIALYTRLLFQNKISQANYEKVKEDFEEKHKQKQIEKEKLKELEKALGKKPKPMTSPQPIKSPLLVSTIQTAFYEGILTEFEVCERLNIKPNRFSEYIQ